MDHYYSQQMRDAVHNLIGNGTLRERLSHTQQSIAKLSIHGHDNKPEYVEYFAHIKEKLSRLGELSENEMLALSTAILDLYVRVKIDWYRWEQTNPN
jgi:hypothetical protein